MLEELQNCCGRSPDDDWHRAEAIIRSATAAWIVSAREVGFCSVRISWCATHCAVSMQSRLPDSGFWRGLRLDRSGPPADPAWRREWVRALRHPFDKCV